MRQPSSSLMDPYIFLSKVVSISRVSFVSVHTSKPFVILGLIRVLCLFNFVFLVDQSVWRVAANLEVPGSAARSTQPLG